MNFETNAPDITSRCIICLSPPPADGDPDHRSYFNCCGKPMCNGCKVDYNHWRNEILDLVDCPACRSTFGQLFVIHDYNTMPIIKLVRDGTRLNLYVSDRAMRQVQRSWDFLAARSRQGVEVAVFYAYAHTTRLEIQHTVLNFLAQEAVTNPDVKALYRAYPGFSPPTVIYKVRS
jgi:hypothetical protein